MEQQQTLTLTSERSFTTRAKIETVMLDRHRWDALKGKVSGLGDQSQWMQSAAWGLAGVAVSGVFAIIAWAFTYESLAEDLRAQFGWMWTVLVTITAIGVAGATCLFFADRGQSSARRTAAAAVLDDMDLMLE